MHLCFCTKSKLIYLNIHWLKTYFMNWKHSDKLHEFDFIYIHPYNIINSFVISWHWLVTKISLYTQNRMFAKSYGQTNPNVASHNSHSKNSKIQFNFIVSRFWSFSNYFCDADTFRTVIDNGAIVYKFFCTVYVEHWQWFADIDIML